MSTERSKTDAFSFGSVLFFIFLVLKLTHYIDWSWWWITAPFWLPLAIFVPIYILLLWIKYR